MAFEMGGELEQSGGGMVDALVAPQVFDRPTRTALGTNGRAPAKQLGTAERQAPRSIVERELRIEIGPEGETCLIRVVGELDLGTVPVLERELHRVLSHGLPRVILDLEDLEFIDSTGIVCLVKATRRSNADGDRLRIIGANGQVDRVLRLTGVRDLLPVIET